MATSPRRVGGRTRIDVDPDRLVWILSVRESADRPEQVKNQLTDLREFVAAVGGRIDREIPENDVSAFKRRRVRLPDGTYGYRVVRPEWEAILTALRRGECNALAVPDIDRATRDPRMLEDIIEVVEHYGVYVVSRSGNIDLTTDAGISAARDLVNQRNQESRNTSRRVEDGQRHAALKGQNHGGPFRPFGWRKDRIGVNKREAAHIRRELPRILAGVSPLTIAQEWNKRKIPTVTGVPQWRAATIRNIFVNPRICGLRTYRGAVMKNALGESVHGVWEPILTEAEFDAVVKALIPAEPATPSRLGAKGRGYRTIYLLSPFVRCGKCNSRMIGTERIDPRSGKRVEIYRCQSKGAGGCGSVARVAGPINEYVKTLVVAEQKKVELRKVEQLPPWPKARELADLLGRIEESARRYEAGTYSAERYFPSLARMETQEAELRREKRKYEARQEARKITVVDLDLKWDDPDFTTEQRQAAIAKTLTAVVILPAGKGGRFHPDQIKPVFREEMA